MSANVEIVSRGSITLAVDTVAVVLSNHVLASGQYPIMLANMVGAGSSNGSAHRQGHVSPFLSSDCHWSVVRKTNDLFDFQVVHDANITVVVTWLILEVTP